MAAIFYKNVINIDKLTQGVTLICLLIDFPRLAILLFGLLIKEFLLGIMELYSIKKTGVVVPDVRTTSGENISSNGKIYPSSDAENVTGGEQS